MTREEVDELLRSESCIVFSVVKPGAREVHVILGDSREQSEAEAEKVTEKALRAGHSVERGGVRTNVEVEAVFVDGDHVWAEDGDRIKVAHKRVTCERNGEGKWRRAAEEVVGHSWRRFDKHYE